MIEQDVEMEEEVFIESMAWPVPKVADIKDL